MRKANFKHFLVLLMLCCTLPVLAQPANDACGDAISVACGDVIAGTTVGATFDDAGFCGTSNTGPGVWYSFTGVDGDVTFSTCDDASYDTKIGIFEGTCETSITCITGNDDGSGCSGFTSELTLGTTAGTPYLILVHGFGTGTGTFNLSVSCELTSNNDECAGATPIECGETLAGSTTDATFDDVGICGTSNTAPGVWYSIVGNGGLITLSTCNQAAYDTKISIFTGGCGSLVCLGGNDDGPGCAGFTSEFQFGSTLGETYLVLIHGFSSATGDFDLTASCLPPSTGEPNDDCADAISITCGDVVSGSTVNANFDAVTPCTSTPAPGVWYSYVAGAESAVTVSTCSDNTDYDTYISVYLPPCSSPVCLGGVDDDFDCPSSIFQTTVTVFGLSPGIELLFMVHGFGGTSTGNFELSVECIAPIANDGPCDADPLVLGVVTPFHNFGATADPGEVSPGPGTEGSSCNSQDGWCSFETFVDNSVWYTFEAPPSGAVVVNAESFDLQVAVWTVGDCADYGTYTEVAANDDSNPGGGLFDPQVDMYCLTPGATYYVQLDGFAGAAGEGFVLADALEDVLPSVTISSSELDDLCQGGSVVLTADSDEADTYLWSTGEVTQSIEVNASGDYSVTITSEHGCTATATKTVVYDAGGILSAYTILGTDEVHLHGDNVVVTGGVGVIKEGKKAKLHDNAQVLTFTQASKVDITGTSASAVVNLAPADVVLPPFYVNPHDSDNDVKVEKDEVVVLTDCIFDKLDIKENATVTFTCTNIFVRDLHIHKGVTLIFSGSSNLVVDKKLKVDKNSTINPTGEHVQVYVDDKFEVKEGSNVTARVYAKKDIHAHGKDGNPITMTGLFIGKKIHGDKDVTWNWDTYCNPPPAPDAPPPPPCVPLVVSITTDNFASETSWELRDENLDVIASGAPGSLVSATTTEVFNGCVDPECYTFTLFDSFGDGICCDWGLGTYSVTYDGVTTVSPTGGDFVPQNIPNGNSETISVGPCPAPRIAFQEEQVVAQKLVTIVSLYPNPITSIAKLSVVPAEDGGAIIDIFDMSGRTIATLYDGAAYKGQVIEHQINSEMFSNSGIYIYRVTIGQETFTDKFIINK